MQNIFISKATIDQGTRLTKDLVDISFATGIQLKNYIHKIRGIINECGEYVPDDVEVEVSHHKGIENIESVGCCLINIINRNYCKKLIIMTKGQFHPEQHHKVKEETFRVLYGELSLKIDEKTFTLKRGGRPSKIWIYTFFQS